MPKQSIIWNEGSNNVVLISSYQLIIKVSTFSLVRLSLSTNKYQVIKLPIDLAECQQGAKSFIGRSGNGVCFGALDDMARLRVWMLDESDGNKIQWVLN